MNITFVDHAGDPGGGQLGLLRYAQSPHRTANLRCIFLTGGPIVDELTAAGVEVDVLDDSIFGFQRLPTYAHRLRLLLKQSENQAIVANSLYAAVALSLVVKPGPWIYYSRVSMGTLTGWKRLIAMRWVFRRADAFLANSKWTASCIPDDLRSRPMRVAYPISGIEPRSAPLARRGFMEDGVLRIASLSRPDRWKGIDLVLQAAGDIANRGESVKVDIYGGTFFSDPEYVNELRNIAANLPIDVGFHGHVTDVDTVLRSSDLMILGNRTPEPFGQVVAQGLAAGCVPVVPDSGGPLEMIDDGSNGFVYPPSDRAALVSVLSRLIGEPDAAVSASQKGPISAGPFFDSATVDGLERAIEHVIATIGVKKASQ